MKGVRIFGVNVSGVVESILASGFPMRDAGFDKWYDDVRDLQWWMDGTAEGLGLSKGRAEWCEKQLKRAKVLGGCGGGESHDCYLCGIVVAFNITAPRYWYPELQRYHFMDIVSSTSTMHKLRSVCSKVLAGEMDWRDCFAEGKFGEGVVKSALGAMNVVMNDSSLDDNEKVRQIKGLLPESYLQTCRITTNYRQLKTWVRQRSTHRLAEWREVCEWIHTLPWFDELCGFVDSGEC